MRLPRWAWFVWIGVGLALETFAILTAAPGDTLTETVVQTLPEAFVLGFLAWAYHHFDERF